MARRSLSEFISTAECPPPAAFCLMVLAAAGDRAGARAYPRTRALRLVYGKDEIIVVLVTYAAFLILEDVIRLDLRPASYALYQPLGAAGTLDVGTFVLSGYDIRPGRAGRVDCGGRQLCAQIYPLGPAADGRDFRS